jgi:hypothetical protein
MRDQMDCVHLFPKEKKLKKSVGPNAHNSTPIP